LRRLSGNQLHTNLNMSKLVVVTGQVNIDDVIYSHAHTCTVQGHLKEFSHAHNPLYASLNMSKLVVAVQENIDDVGYSHAHTCTVQGHRKEFSHAHTCAKWRQPLLLPARRNSRNFATCTPAPPPPLPDGIPGNLMTSAFSHVHTCIYLW